MLEPAAAFFMYVAIGSPRMVGFPLCSQSAMYSVRPTGMPLTDGRCSSSSELKEGSLGEGKTVETVAWAVRFKIRRAITADSYGVGILTLLSNEGFENMCCEVGGVRKLLAARGRIAGRRILMYNTIKLGDHREIDFH
jgi:hypothetical protein